MQKTSSQAHGNRKQANMGILIFDKVNFKSKLLRRDKPLVIKWFIQQDDITYAMNNEYFIKQIIIYKISDGI